MSASRFKRSPVEQRIIELIEKMPFGQQARFDGIKDALHARRPLTFEDLAEYLEHLHKSLVGVAEDYAVTEQENGAMKAEIVSAGRLVRRMFPELATLAEQLRPLHMPNMFEPRKD